MLKVWCCHCILLRNTQLKYPWQEVNPSLFEALGDGLVSGAEAKLLTNNKSFLPVL